MQMGKAEGDRYAASPPDQRGPNLTARAASGLRWSSLSFGMLMAINLVYTATISRLLDPAAFGLMALANLVVLFAQYFARMGLASALVQQPKLSDEDIGAASTAGVALGVVCFVVVWVLAPVVSAVFQEPALSPVLRTLGVSFLFHGWSMTGTGLLRRQLRFRELSIITVGTNAFGYLVVGVGSAILGAGVWSLVAALLVTQASVAAWQYVLTRHTIRPPLHWEPYRGVGGYGMRLSGAHMVDYVGSNLDTFTVGRIASTAVLGQYSRAYSLVFQPLRNYLTQALTTVMFSHLSRIQDDRARLRRAYLSVLALAGILLFPLCAGVAVAARELVWVMLGRQWGLAATIVPWFALAGGCSVIAALSQALAEARAELNRSVAVQAAYLLALAASLAIALEFRSNGIWVIAAAVAGAEVARHVGYLGLMRRVLELSAAQLWQAYGPAAIASVGVALAIALTRQALAQDVPTLALFASEVGAGALALALCIRFCPLPAIRRELWMRLTAAGVLGGVDGLRWRLAPLVLGQPEAAPKPEPGP
jgi:lipopolysaccharide exporter